MQYYGRNFLGPKNIYKFNSHWGYVGLLVEFSFYMFFLLSYKYKGLKTLTTYLVCRSRNSYVFMVKQTYIIYISHSVSLKHLLFLFIFTNFICLLLGIRISHRWFSNGMWDCAEYFIFMKEKLIQFCIPIQLYIVEPSEYF